MLDWRPLKLFFAFSLIFVAGGAIVFLLQGGAIIVAVLATGGVLLFIPATVILFFVWLALRKRTDVKALTFLLILFTSLSFVSVLAIVFAVLQCFPQVFGDCRPLFGY